MNKKRGGKRDGSGRPKINGGIKRVLISITETHHAYLIEKYGKVSPGIRALIEADMAGEDTRGQRSDSAEQYQEDDNDSQQNE